MGNPEFLDAGRVDRRSATTAADPAGHCTYFIYCI